MNEDQVYTLAQEYNQQGMILYSRDKYDEARIYFQKAIEEDPMYIDSYINMAQVDIMEDKFDSAIKWLNKASRIDKKNGVVYFHLGNVALLQGDTEGARTHYAKAVSLGYDNIQIYINLAADAEERGDIDTAISYYNRVISIDKFNAFAKARKAQILIAVNRKAEALKVCDHMIEYNPDIFEGYHYKFAILCDMDKYEEAEALLNRALELFPDDEELYYDQARLYQMQGRFEEALAVIDQKIVMDDEKRTSMITFKAELLLSVERVDEALAILLEEYPKSKDGEVAFLLNSIYMALKDYEPVLYYAQEVIDHMEPGDYYYSAVYYRAVALGKLGRTEEAKQAHEEAIKLFRAACGRNPGMMQLYFYRAMCHQELGQYDKVLELTDYLLNVDENLLEARLIRMKTFEAMGSVNAAEQERNIILSKKPELLAMMEG